MMYADNVNGLVLWMIVPFMGEYNGLRLFFWCLVLWWRYYGWGLGYDVWDSF